MRLAPSSATAHKICTVSAQVTTGDEFDAGIDKGCYESHVARKPVPLGDHECNLGSIQTRTVQTLYTILRSIPPPDDRSSRDARAF